MLEVFNNLFMNIAEQMGLQLQNTAYSVNIKERLDFSCALFDAEGNLIANAPHMPVHLGSMGESIKTVIRENAGRMPPGDVYVLNDPYHGGTHLPDVTVITPVFDDAGRGRSCSTSARAATTPTSAASRPARCRRSRRASKRRACRSTTSSWSTRGALARARDARAAGSARYPARNPEQNMADLQAQIAANEKGVQELRKMVAQFGLDVVRAYMRHVQDNAEESVRRVIDALNDGAVHAASWTTARGSAWRSASTQTARSADDRFHRHLATSCPTTSTRPRRCAWRRCCTCSARWWTTTSRSTPAA